MSDLINRQAAIDRIESLTRTWGGDDGVYPLTETDKAINYAIEVAASCIYNLPSAQPEPLTDKEQRIFLAAMAREEKVCKQVDDECRDRGEPYEDLVRICHEIRRKVKDELWT